MYCPTLQILWMISERILAVLYTNLANDYTFLYIFPDEIHAIFRFVIITKFLKSFYIAWQKFYN